ncbi:MAG: T9SS type A sorting domain-containing protein [Bacteroidota bacterium]
MKTFILTTLLGLSSLTLWGQIQVRDVVGAEGGVGQSGTLTIVYSIGEPIVSAPELTGGLLASEGFLQPLPLLAAPLSDSVWPGDANQDGVADQLDLLALGIGYGSTGPARPNASLNWQAQWAPNWNDSLITQVNYKHLDCNGDGIINAADTLAINLNYGLTHNKTDILGTNGPPIFLNILEDSVAVGDTATLIIELGSDSMPAQDIYGLAFTLDLDTSLYQLASARIDYTNSWLGVKNVDMITFDKKRESEQRIALAMVGTDQTDRQGYGRVGKISIIMIDDLAGKMDLFETFSGAIGNLVAVNRLGELRSLHICPADSAVLYERSTAIDPTAPLALRIYPNPAQEWIKVQLTNSQAQSYRLLNMHGQVVKSSDQAFREAVIPVADIASGLYFLEIRAQGKTQLERVQVRR